MKKFGIVLMAVFLSSYGMAKWRVGTHINAELEKSIDEVNKFREFYGILNYWLTLKEENKSMECYFTKHEYYDVAIYGMKDLGIHLYEELKNTMINVKYGIDKNADCIYSEIEVFEPNVGMPKVDVIVVTAIHYFDEIKRELKRYTDSPVISLSDVLKEV